MTDIDWRSALAPGALVTERVLLAEYAAVFELDWAATNRVRRYLHAWRDAARSVCREEAERWWNAEACARIRQPSAISCGETSSSCSPAATPT